jgi:hypothetical protein
MFKQQSKSKTLLLSLILTSFSCVYSTAQNDPDPGKTSISTKPFADGTNHWYNIKDKTNIINPVPNQPQYPETKYAEIADNILYFQRDNGGWPKNYDIRAVLTNKQIIDVINTKSVLHTTFDNATTYTHIYYLAQTYTLTQNDKYKNACLKGIVFLTYPFS